MKLNYGWCSIVRNISKVDNTVYLLFVVDLLINGVRAFYFNNQNNHSNSCSCNCSPICHHTHQLTSGVYHPNPFQKILLL